MTKIFTMTHKSFSKPEGEIYIPLQVGRALSTDLGYLCDNTGDNISDQNPYFSELTGIYWLWKNYPDTDENIGICHYRRFFMNDQWEILNEKDYDDILTQYDIITSKAMYSDCPYSEYYARGHFKKDIDIEAEVVKELYPEDYPYFEQVMQGNKYYFGNLCVTSNRIFKDYCAWMFPILFEVQKRVDISNYDQHQKRIFGFLSEQLLLVYITARHLKVYECPVGISDEKAETKELKLAVSQLLKLNKPKDAYNLFYEVLKIRPDLMLSDSDLKNELPVIEKILQIIIAEQEQQSSALLSFSNNLSDLITHVNNLIAINYGNVPSAEADEYLKRTNVSDIAIEIIKMQ